MNYSLVFIVYYCLNLNSKISCKSFIKASSQTQAKSIFLKKMNRDLPNASISKIYIYKLNQEKYRNTCISDKHWDKILNFSYPNGKHRLYKFSHNSWFKSSLYNRKKDGTFKIGHTPWNKGLKIQFINKNKDGKFSKSRTNLGRFKKGIKPVIIGSSSCN